ncbi:hypothetical protein D3C78_1835600 [compost metagenome]
MRVKIGSRIFTAAIEEPNFSSEIMVDFDTENSATRSNRRPTTMAYNTSSTKRHRMTAMIRSGR